MSDRSPTPADLALYERACEVRERAYAPYSEFPVGAGLSFRDASGFVLDLRGTYRATTSSTLLFDPRTNQYASLQTWEAGAALGYEF